MKLLPSLTITLMTIGMLATQANAAVTIHVIQNGTNVQIVGSGTLNLDSVGDLIADANPATHNFNARNSADDGLFIGVFPTEGDLYQMFGKKLERIP